MKRLLFFCGIFMIINCSFSQFHWDEKKNGLPSKFLINDFEIVEGSVYAAGTFVEDYSCRLYRFNEETNKWMIKSTSGLSSLQSCTAFANINGLLLLSGFDEANPVNHLLYKSTDGGISWSLSNSGLPSNYSICDINSDDDVIYIAGTITSDPYEVRLYKSTNYGLSWNKVNSVGLGNLVTCSAIEIIDGDFILASSTGYSFNDYKLYISHNDGENWEQLNNSIPNNTLFMGLESYAGYTYAAGTIITEPWQSVIYQSEVGENIWAKTPVSGLNNLITVNCGAIIEGRMFLAGSISYGSQLYSVFMSEVSQGVQVSLQLSGDLDFDDVLVNTIHKEVFEIVNNGNVSLNVSSIDYPEGFSGSWQSGTIPAGGSKEVEVTFSPTEVREYTGLITVHSNAGGGENTLNVSGTGLSDPTSMNEDPSELKIKVYPNPAKENICIEVEEELLGEEFQLVDVLGLVQKKDILIGKKTKIAIGHLSPGIYLLTINNHPELSRRVIIQ